MPAVDAHRRYNCAPFLASAHVPRRRHGRNLRRVDSAVAASRLIDDGYDVAGLFMKNWDEDDGTEYCTAEADLADAERICERLGIELHTASFAAEYWDSVFEAFSRITVRA